MKNIRIKKKADKKVVFESLTQEQRIELDKNIIDVVLRLLFDNAHVDELDFQKDVISKANVVFPQNEVERLWEVLVSSVWVSPLVGFGRAGKLELTNAGYQMMSQYGSYKQYLAAVSPAPAVMEPPIVEQHTVKKDINGQTGHEL